MIAFSVGKPTAMLGAAVLLLVGTGTGCATKKHVRQVVGPVEARVTSAEKKATEQQAAIGELETGLSRADERAMDAERKATAAGQAAATANDSAQKAGQAAQTAHGRANEAYQLSESTRSRLGQLSENIDNYKLVTTENILFGFNRHQLTKEAEAQLDQAVSQLQGTKNYVLEIQGFTDHSGSAATNLELSRRRADSVVRYLTSKHSVPLRKINVLGIGEDDPTADNKTREGRKQARRVEIKVFSLDLGGDASAGAGAAPRTTTPSQPTNQ
jgi:outer membrane protein OmpA-like peptidoglycan-associated protein